MFDFTLLEGNVLSDAEKASIEAMLPKIKATITEIWKLDAEHVLARLITNLQRCVSNGAVPSAVLAQMILESGWFEHEESAEGIKATSAQIQSDEAVTESTHEVQEGQSVPQSGSFFECDTPEEAFDNYFAYLKRQKPVSAQFCPADELGFLTYLQNHEAPAANGTPSGAYSTAGDTYVNSVRAVSQSNNLTCFNHL